MSHLTAFFHWIAISSGLQLLSMPLSKASCNLELGWVNGYCISFEYDLYMGVAITQPKRQF
jgi:hypothetical protein